MPLTIASYSFDDPSYACARLRVVEPVRALGKAVRLLFGVVPRGAGHIVRGDIAAEADVLLVQRVFPCAQTAPLLETLFASGKPVIYDTDDDWTSLPASHPFAPDMRVPDANGLGLFQGEEIRVLLAEQFLAGMP